MPPETWINIISSIFCARAGLKFAWTTLANAIRTLLVLLNPSPEGKLDWPTFQNILDFLNAVPETAFATKPEYVRSLKQALQAVCLSSAKTFSASQGFDVEDIIRKRQSAVIAIPNMEPGWVRQLCKDIIISKALKGKIERSEQSDCVDTFFFVEEADADIDAESEKLFSDSMSPLSEYFKKGRAFGLGAAVSVSSLLQVSRIIKENATVHCSFRPSDPRAAIEAAETLMLPPYGELTLGHLKKGECLLRQIGPWHHAMKVKVDHMPFPKTCIRDYDSHPYKPAKQIFQIPQVREYIGKIRAAKTKPKKDQKAKSNPHRELAIDLLKLSAENPFVPVNRLFKSLGNHHYKVQQTVRELIENEGWAKFEYPRISRSNIALIELTEQGYQSINHPIPKQRRGRGGIAHRHYAHWLLIHFEKSGHKAQLELVIPGTNHPVDAGVWMENKLNVFEICVTAFDNVLSHIEAALSSDEVECLTFITSTMGELKKVKKQLKSKLILMKYANKIKFDVIANYMPKEI
jgi:hypothetical protein